MFKINVSVFFYLVTCVLQLPYTFEYPCTPNNIMFIS